MGLFATAVGGALLLTVTAASAGFAITGLVASGLITSAQTASVPELEILAMFLTGIGLTSLAARRRHPTRVVAA